MSMLQSDVPEPGFLIHRFELRLEDELVLSARPATTGGHTSLDHVPGAAVLGAVAAALGDEIDGATRFMLFHSGKVRFGNARPLADGGAAAVPMPLSLHERKGEDAIVDKRMLAGRTFNLADSDGRRAALAGNGQPKQLRKGYLTPDGRVLQPATQYRLKSAIDAPSGRVAEGQLFGYQSLLPGQRFVCDVAFDADVPATWRERVTAVLNGRVRLGRSRSAQFGRVRGRLLDTLPAQAARVRDAHGVTLLLCADLAVLADGVPVLAPSPQALGLPPGQLILERSFIRTRRYAPYNAHRRLPDLERQVLCAGSVLTFAFDEKSDPAALGVRLARGLGAYREAGLGQVLVDPPWLDGAHPRFEAAPEQAADEAVPLPMPEHPLASWLCRNTQRKSGDDAIARWADRMVATLVARQEAARKLHGLRDFELAGPTRTQWGQVAALAEASRTDGLVLRTRLFGTGTADGEDHGMGFCRGKDDWERTTGRMIVGEDESKRPENFRDWLRRALDEAVEDEPAVAANPGLALARLAGAAQKMLTQRNWKKLLEDKR